MTGKPLVLIVDDEQYIREMVGLKLSSCGFEVQEASGGKEGLEKVKGLRPDIVLLDMEMPDMNGLAVFKKLKEDGFTVGTNIFFFTGKDNPRQDMVELSKIMAKGEGAVDLIRKEMDLNKIVEYMKQSLNMPC